MSDHPKQTPFYVGYAPTPSFYRRFLWVLIPILLVLSLVVAMLVASKQSDPGNGVWDLSNTLTLEGTLYEHPHGALHTTNPQGESVTVLLVSQTKFGVGERIAGLNGKRTKVVGNLIERDGQYMITVLKDNSGIQALDGDVAPVDQAPIMSLGSHTLVGEIIDSKCALGAMKPGDGKAHKTCATLCILGGMPPMFMTKDASGNARFYLFTDASGQAADFATIKPYIADAVEVHGEIVQQGNMQILRAELHSLRFL